MVGSLLEKDLGRVLVPRHGLFGKWSQAFEESVRLAVCGQRSDARQTFELIDGPALAFWFHVTAQYAGRHRAMLVDKRSRAARVAAPREKLRMPPKRTWLDVLERDRWSCRYCSSPLLMRSQLDRFRGLIGEERFPIGSTNLTKHGAYFVHLATIDHVRAHARGGENGIENLAASCHACNFGKDAYELEELGLVFPAEPGTKKFSKWVATVRELDSVKVSGRGTV